MSYDHDINGHCSNRLPSLLLPVVDRVEVGGVVQVDAARALPAQSPSASGSIGSCAIENEFIPVSVA